MKQVKETLAAGLFTVTVLAATAGTSHAQMYTESGDAGQTLATAQTVPSATTTINGTIATGNASDADLYKLTLANSGTYTFSTVNAYTTTGGVDTEVSLFNATGTPLLENDDASGMTFESSITMTLSAGTYYIGVASSGNEPANSNSQLLFAGLNQNGDTTAARGPASGVNPTTLSAFNGNESDMTTTGQYQIGISAAPEPSTWATIALGGIVSTVTFLRRRRVA